MRAHASLTILCLAGAALADDGVLGTKGDAVTTPAGQGGLGVMPMLQMVFALGIVMLLLKFVLPKVMGKMNKKLVTGVNSSLKIEESATFAGGTLYIVRARSKTLLLSVSTQGVNCLADVTEPEVKTEPDFEDMFNMAPGEELPEVDESLDPAPAPVAAANSAVIETALERLSRLTG